MHETNGKLDASGMAFQALAWALMEESRAERLLSLTGLTPEGLRSSVMERSTQAGDAERSAMMRLFQGEQIFPLGRAYRKNR